MTDPSPHVMPIDREQWKSRLSLCNFVNSYYQYKDLVSLGSVKNILLIGPGQGLETEILRWRGYNITTFDIDETFSPDIIGSVHQMDVFDTMQFDVVIASHVLEHMAESYLCKSLSEISRVGKHALIYLPVTGRHMQLRWIAGIKSIDLSFIADIYNYFSRPDGKSPRYCGGQHYWEIGFRGFRVKDMLNKFMIHFDIISHYRNRDWLPSYNFILRSKIDK